MEEIDRAIYEKYISKLRAEQREKEGQIARMRKRVSNLDECIEAAITLSQKLATVWHLGDYKAKQALQFLLCPDGIYYNRKTEECRTPVVSSVCSCIAGLAGISGGHKKSDNHKNMIVARFVPRTGIEPVIPP